MKTVQKKHVKATIILTYAISIAIACTLLYFTIPYLLNYGPDTINTEFDRQVSGGFYYYQQILLVSFCVISLVSLILFVSLKDIDYYPLYKTNKTKYKKNINYIKKLCLNLPNKVLVAFVIIPLIFSFGVLFLQTSYLTSADFKLMLLVFVLSTITISLVNIYIRRICSKILIELENTSFSGAKPTGLVQRLLFQFLPIMIICILFTYLAISAIYEKNNANLLSKYYINQFKTDLAQLSIKDVDELKDLLTKIDLYNSGNILFIADNNLNFIYQTGEISDYFKKYAAELSLKNNYEVYDYYGTSGQGILYPVTLANGQTYYLGAYYIIYSSETILYIVSLLVFLGILCALIIYAFTHELAKNVREIRNSLKLIANSNETISKNELYITSVDEIGELVEVYNTIQALTVEHVNEIHKNQNMLMERERLASLGQLIGGIAHNLKTPIMSISGAAEGLTDLIKEYDSSIGDPEVNNQDHHDIAKDMSSWVEKIKDYTSYMSDIITAVKGQAVTLSETEDMSFDIEELLKRVNILMRHELKNAIVYLNISMKTDENIVIHGDVNSLVQVINNMVSNAIQAYDGKTDQNIDLIVDKQDNNLLISVKDYASGLPKKVKDKLFKEMITTKGKNGTGLGLYMSYSTIKAHFNGNILVDSEEGKGTTFTIILPLQ